MLISCTRVFYSSYLSLHGNLSTRPWVLLLIFLWFRVKRAYLFVLISLVSSVISSLFLWGRESLLLSRYYNSFLTVLCNYSVYLPVYSMTEILVLLYSFGRVYGRSIVPTLSYLQLTIHRLMVELKDKT